MAVLITPGARAVLAALRAAARLRCPRTPSAGAMRRPSTEGAARDGAAEPRLLARGLTSLAGCAGVALLVVALLASSAQAARIKDIATVEGMRQNQLQGYGLVVGLNGTGDSQQALFTPQTVLNYLKRRGITLDINPRQLQIKNVAAVLVTATLPPFARQGTHIAAQVSSMGDADSLQGGTLISTPLFGADGQVYAVGQGALSLGGGFAASGPNASATKSFPTVALLTDGAFVEKEVPATLGAGGVVTIALNQPDFTTAHRVAEAVNMILGREAATPTDAGTISVALRTNGMDEAVETVTRIERAEVQPDVGARVVLNERTGTVVIGNDVRVLPIAIAHGSLQVIVRTDYGVSQPGPFSYGETTVVPETDIKVEEGKPRNLMVLKPGVTLGDLVAGLNALGVTPQDLIAILQALKAAGALEAALEIM